MCIVTVDHRCNDVNEISVVNAANEAVKQITVIHTLVIDVFQWFYCFFFTDSQRYLYDKSFCD